jgi:hypothetical protein
MANIGPLGQARVFVHWRARRPPAIRSILHPVKGGESRVPAPISSQPAGQAAAARAAGAGRPVPPVAAPRGAGQGVAAGRASRTAAASGRPQGPAAARGTAAMTLSPPPPGLPGQAAGPARPDQPAAASTRKRPATRHGQRGACRVYSYAASLSTTPARQRANTQPAGLEPNALCRCQSLSCTR